MSFDIFNWKVKQLCKNMDAVENREKMKYAKLIIKKYKEYVDNL